MSIHHAVGRIELVDWLVNAECTHRYSILRSIEYLWCTSERGAVANDDVIVRARYVNNRADSTTFGASILIMPIYGNKMDRRNDICS